MVKSIIRSGIVGAIAICGLTGVSRGAFIAVPNGDFETNAASRQGGGSIGQVNGQATPGFTATGTTGTFSPYQSGTTAYDETQIDNDHGQLLGFTQGTATLTNVVGGTYQANTIYALRVKVGDSYENPGVVSGSPVAYQISLLNGSTILGTPASSATFPAAYTAVTAQTSFNTNDIPSAVGQPISLRISSFTNGSATYDNVTLEAVLAPEPGSLSLLGAVGLLAFRRHRRASAVHA